MNKGLFFATASLVVLAGGSASALEELTAVQQTDIARAGQAIQALPTDLRAYASLLLTEASSKINNRGEGDPPEPLYNQVVRLVNQGEQGVPLTPFRR